ncbi:MULTISPECIES: ABC transporter ATP-binding protein [unclassified Moraxella]|uniref:ABC transporter ATP-binding protein n=1 Tax=unclassified Moraxella TaxID=2685852 RepID=UPI00359EC262
MMCVEIVGLSFKFGEQSIFHDFDFTLPKGRFTSLLGASGVGKSTLLRIIAGLEQNFTGRIGFTDGIQLSYLAQHDSLYPWLSVLDNVQLSAHLSGQKTPHTKEEALLLLKKVKMDAYLHKKTYELSGGQRQRVALARTLMMKADLVLMDEPFSALDAVTRHELQALSYDLLQQKTVLLITHDPQEAIRLSDDIYVLKQSPAVISTKISPSGRPVRQLDDGEFGVLHARLLSELSV